MPSLIIERGQGKGFGYDLQPGATTVVGRDPACDVIIADPASSRRHFQIRQEAGVWYLDDLKSRNCTFLNETQVLEEQRLAFGDRIQVGETVFSFLEEGKETGKKGGLNGKVIGGYLILERVGRGGMGTVYKARQISLNREVALKILSSKYARDPAFVEQFVAEARAAGQLNHPNVVQVFDVGQAGGLHFFSMEFMDGEGVQDLLATCEDGRLDWTEALPIIIDATQGLVFAEKRGIIHRDIKPDNLMRTASGTVKIGDLGLARHADEEGDGRIFGTPHFVSPEQAQGKRLTHAADIYSLGATFFRIVAGRTPFTADSVKEILRKQILEEPVPVRTIVPGFPDDLQVILSKMMAKKVEDRYQSATTLLDDLQAFTLAHQIELAGGRKTTKPLIAMIVVLVLALGGVVAFILSRKDEPPPQGPKTVFVNVGTPSVVPTQPTIDPAEQQKRIEDAAGLAYFRAKDSLGDSGEIELAERERWEQIAEKYDELVTEHPKSKVQIKQASDRAEEIRTVLREKQAEYDATVTVAKEWWGRSKGDLEAKEAGPEWSATISLASSLLNSDDAAKHLKHLGPEKAQEYLEGAQARVIVNAQSAWEQTRTAAEAKLATDAGAALSDVASWATTAAANAGEVEELTALATAAQDWVDEKGGEVRQGLEEALARDLVLWIDAYRAIRHAEGEGEGSNLVYQYDFAAAAAELEQAADRMVTYVYQDLARGKAAELRVMQSSWEQYIELLAAGKVFGETDEVRGLAEVRNDAKATVILDDPDKAPTKDSVSVMISIRGGQAPKTFDWGRRFTPSELAEIWVVHKLRKLPADLALGFARIFAELGAGTEARSCLVRASQGDAGSAGERASVQAEIDAILDYQQIVFGRDQAPGELMKAVDLWRERHTLTSFAILVDRPDSAQAPSQLLPATEEEFFANWGQRPK